MMKTIEKILPFFVIITILVIASPKSNCQIIDGQIKDLSNPIEPNDAATKLYVDLLEARIEAIEGIKDIDNNRYRIVHIASQTWMAENLKVTRFNDGTPITLANDFWDTHDEPGYTSYDVQASPFGALYNWLVVDQASNGNKNVCPTGWHVPSNFEWIALANYLGGANVAGGKLKEAGLTHYSYYNIDATNESEFSGLPGGYVNQDGDFFNIHLAGHWWTTTTFNNLAISRNLEGRNGILGQAASLKRNGFSIRCIKN